MLCDLNDKNEHFLLGQITIPGRKTGKRTFRNKTKGNILTISIILCKILFKAEPGHYPKHNKHLLYMQKYTPFFHRK